MEVDDINHSNLAHIGGIILDMSKRIMNEVINLCTDLYITLFIQTLIVYILIFPTEKSILMLYGSLQQKIWKRINR